MPTIGDRKKAFPPEQICQQIPGLPGCESEPLITAKDGDLFNGSIDDAWKQFRKEHPRLLLPKVVNVEGNRMEEAFSDTKDALKDAAYSLRSATTTISAMAGTGTDDFSEFMGARLVAESRVLVDEIKFFKAGVNDADLLDKTAELLAIVEDWLSPYLKLISVDDSFGRKFYDDYYKIVDSKTMPLAVKISEQARMLGVLSGMIFKGHVATAMAEAKKVVDAIPAKYEKERVLAAMTVMFGHNALCGLEYLEENGVFALSEGTREWFKSVDRSRKLTTFEGLDQLASEVAKNRAGIVREQIGSIVREHLSSNLGCYNSNDKPSGKSDLEIYGKYFRDAERNVEKGDNVVLVSDVTERLVKVTNISELLLMLPQVESAMGSDHLKEVIQLIRAGSLNKATQDIVAALKRRSSLDWSGGERTFVAFFDKKRGHNGDFVNIPSGYQNVEDFNKRVAKKINDLSIEMGTLLLEGSPSAGVFHGSVALSLDGTAKMLAELRLQGANRVDDLKGKDEASFVFHRMSGLLKRALGGKDRLGKLIGMLPPKERLLMQRMESAIKNGSLSFSTFNEKERQGLGVIGSGVLKMINIIESPENHKLFASLKALEPGISPAILPQLEQKLGFDLNGVSDVRVRNSLERFTGNDNKNLQHLTVILKVVGDLQDDKDDTHLSSRVAIGVLDVMGYTDVKVIGSIFAQKGITLEDDDLFDPDRLAKALGKLRGMFIRGTVAINLLQAIPLFDQSIFIINEVGGKGDMLAGLRDFVADLAGEIDAITSGDWDHHERKVHRNEARETLQIEREGNPINGYKRKYSARKWEEVKKYYEAARIQWQESDKSVTDAFGIADKFDNVSGYEDYNKLNDSPELNAINDDKELASLDNIGSTITALWIVGKLIPYLKSAVSSAPGFSKMTPMADSYAKMLLELDDVTENGALTKDPKSFIDGVRIITKSFYITGINSALKTFNQKMLGRGQLVDTLKSGELSQAQAVLTGMSIASLLVGGWASGLASKTLLRSAIAMGGASIASTAPASAWMWGARGLTQLLGLGAETVAFFGATDLAMSPMVGLPEFNTEYLMRIPGGMILFGILKVSHLIRNFAAFSNPAAGEALIDGLKETQLAEVVSRGSGFRQSATDTWSLIKGIFSGKAGRHGMSLREYYATLPAVQHGRVMSVLSSKPDVLGFMTSFALLDISEAIESLSPWEVEDPLAAGGKKGDLETLLSDWGNLAVVLLCLHGSRGDGLFDWWGEGVREKSDFIWLFNKVAKGLKIEKLPKNPTREEFNAGFDRLGSAVRALKDSKEEPKRLVYEQIMENLKNIGEESVLPRLRSEDWSKKDISRINTPIMDFLESIRSRIEDFRVFKDSAKMFALVKESARRERMEEPYKQYLDFISISGARPYEKFNERLKAEKEELPVLEMHLRELRTAKNKMLTDTQRVLGIKVVEAISRRINYTYSKAVEFIDLYADKDIVASNNIGQSQQQQKGPAVRKALTAGSGN